MRCETRGPDVECVFPSTLAPFEPDVDGRIDDVGRFARKGAQVSAREHGHVELHAI